MPTERTALTDEAAFAVLEPYFLAAKSVFEDYCVERGLGTQIRKTQFECRRDIHDSERHFAATSVDGLKVFAAPELADLPEDTVAAIFAHEFGHVVDHLYPGRYLVVEEELCFFEVEPVDEVRVARVRQWRKRDDDEVELAADMIAEQATGHRIGYSGPCMLQGLNRGVPRPKGLR